MRIMDLKSKRRLRQASITWKGHLAIVRFMSSRAFLSLLLLWKVRVAAAAAVGTWVGRVRFLAGSGQRRRLHGKEEFGGGNVMVHGCCWWCLCALFVVLSRMSEWE